MTDLFSDDLNALANDQLYAAIADFAQAQPNESNRHDFKRIWDNEDVKHISAFANTFGGLLIIGVDKGSSSSTAQVIGVTSNRELTTGIASSIASNISPSPSYDIAECHKPGEPSRRLCVIRVRNDGKLYLVTKKGVSPPAWIRNADQTIAADAAQLRMLIDRERESPGSVDGVLLPRAQSILQNMIIGYGYPNIPNWTDGAFQRSQTYFELALIPYEPRWMPLDAREENKLKTLVHNRYRRIASNLGRATPVAYDAVNRTAESFEYRWYHTNLNYECRWQITNRLDFAQATQIKHDNQWSLVDIVMYATLLIVSGSQWWRTFNYFGDGILLGELNVNGLFLARGASEQFIKLFGWAEGDYGLRSEVLHVHQQRPNSQAYVRLNAATMIDTLPRIVTSLMNPLLRGLGHAVMWDEFEDDLRVILPRAISQ